MCVGAGDERNRKWQRHSWAAFTFSAASLLAFPEIAHASDTERYVDAFVTAAGPMVSNLGFSGVAGICVGKAIKVVSGTVALFLGIAFVATQVAASQGLISVNWTNLESMVTKALDQNKDGCAFPQQHATNSPPAVLPPSGLRCLDETPWTPLTACTVPCLHLTMPIHSLVARSTITPQLATPCLMCTRE